MDSLDVTVLHETSNRGTVVRRGILRVIAPQPTEPGKAHLQLVIGQPRGTYHFSIVLRDRDLDWLLGVLAGVTDQGGNDA